MVFKEKELATLPIDQALTIFSRIHPIDHQPRKGHEIALRMMADAVEQVDKKLWADITAGQIGWSNDGVLKLETTELQTKIAVSAIIKKLAHIHESAPVVHMGMLYGAESVLRAVHNSVSIRRRNSIIPVIVSATNGTEVVLPHVVSKMDTSLNKSHKGVVLYTELIDSGASEVAAMAPWFFHAQDNHERHQQIVRRLQQGYGSDYTQLADYYAVVAVLMASSNVVLAVTLSKNKPLLQAIRMLALKNQNTWWGRTQSELLRPMYVLEYEQDKWLMGAGADTGIPMKTLLLAMERYGFDRERLQELRLLQEYKVRVGSTFPGIVSNQQSYKEFVNKVAPLFGQALFS